jgi:DNA-binding transcriptional ArsR family regulator
MVVDQALEFSDREVDRIFRALADATRRDIVRRTLGGEASVSELAGAYDMSFAAVQKHVAMLEGAGLVTKHPHGRERIVRANPDTIRRAQALLERYEQIWRSRIERLDQLLADTDE